MPISGLVITFDRPVAQCSGAISALRAMPEVDLGHADANKLAIVVDTETQEHDRLVWEAVQQLPGVADVAIALVAFDKHTDENDPRDRTSERNDEPVE